MDVDHIIYAVPDLEAAIEAIERRLWVRAVLGGKHPGAGTHNALLSLGEGAYLEILAPDPEQDTVAGPLRRALDFSRPHIATWAANSPDIEARAARAAAARLTIGPVVRASRALPDGDTLRWSFTFPPPPEGDGLVPFLIAWEPGPHPSETSPRGCRLASLRGEHPEPERIGAMLEAIGAEMVVSRGDKPALIATIEGPSGTVELQ